MLHLQAHKVRPGQLERLKSWFAEIERRADEARATFAQEGVTHEIAGLISTSDGYVLIYAEELLDYDAALKAFLESDLPLDAEHKVVMAETLEDLPMTTLLNLRA